MLARRRRRRFRAAGCQDILQECRRCFFSAGHSGHGEGEYRKKSLAPSCFSGNRSRQGSSHFHDRNRREMPDVGDVCAVWADSDPREVLFRKGSGNCDRNASYSRGDAANPFWNSIRRRQGETRGGAVRMCWERNCPLLLPCELPPGTFHEHPYTHPSLVSSIFVCCIFSSHSVKNLVIRRKIC